MCNRRYVYKFASYPTNLKWKSTKGLYITKCVLVVWLLILRMEVYNEALRNTTIKKHPTPRNKICSWLIQSSK